LEHKKLYAVGRVGGEGDKYDINKITILRLEERLSITYDPNKYFSTYPTADTNCFTST